MANLLHSAQAFGDGTHPTTFGVLNALEAIDPEAFRPRVACDMGTGSGILALAMAQRFGCAVVAVDYRLAPEKGPFVREAVDGICRRAPRF